MQPISQAELMQILMSIKGTRMATVITETEVKMNKSGLNDKSEKVPNPFTSITKRATTNVTFGFDYENSVNSQRVREGLDADFESMPRKWGERIKGTTLVMHKGFAYVEAKVNGKPKNVSYTNGTNEVKYENFKMFMGAKSTSSRQEVEKEIQLRDFKLTSIKEIKINGQHYIVA